MENTLMPEKAGQICKIISKTPDLEPDEVYIIAEDPSAFDAENNVLVVGLKELQRHVADPDEAERISVLKCELVVVAEDLEHYIQSWNTGTSFSR